MWERGKNRLSITRQRIREAFSPPGSPEPGMTAYYNDGELSSDTDSEGGKNGEIKEKYEDENENEGNENEDNEKVTKESKK